MKCLFSFYLRNITSFRPHGLIAGYSSLHALLIKINEPLEILRNKDTRWYVLESGFDRRLVAKRTYLTTVQTSPPLGELEEDSDDPDHKGQQQVPFADGVY